MVVGPEAAGSLLVGTVVKSSVDSGAAGENDDEVNSISFLPLQWYNTMEAVKSHSDFFPLCFSEEMTSKLSSPFLKIMELIVCIASRQGCWCSYRNGWSDHPYCWINSTGIP